MFLPLSPVSDQSPSVLRDEARSQIIGPETRVLDHLAAGQPAYRGFAGGGPVLRIDPVCGFGAYYVRLVVCRVQSVNSVTKSARCCVHSVSLALTHTNTYVLSARVLEAS